MENNKKHNPAEKMNHEHGHSHDHKDPEHQHHDHQEHGSTEHQHHGRGSHDEHKGHASHHQHMISDFRKRFWISLGVSIPILLLSPLIQEILGFGTTLQFTGDKYLAFLLSSFVFFYGGHPFISGMIDELKK